MRTAPAPNMIATPGMNPGTIVAGGGGGAGGGSGGSGKKGKKGKGKKGKKGGDKADGGDKSGKDCGGGSAAGACTKHSKKASAGDPVDVCSGAVFTEAHRDLDLDGLIRVFWDRSYSSDLANVDVGLGYGWTFTFDWTLEKKRRSVVVRHMGDEVTFTFEAGLDVAVGNGAWVLRQLPGAYVLDTNDGFFHEFVEVQPGGKKYRLTEVRHRVGSSLTLSHDDAGHVIRITEATGRPIDIEWSNGRIARLRMFDPTTGTTVDFGGYAYDPAGNLVAYADADGAVWEYAYDDAHRLVHHTNPNRVRFFFRYTRDGRCFESWGEHLDRLDPAIDPDVPRLLRDGSPVKGIHHVKLDYADDTTQVIDSQRLRTYHFHEEQIESAGAGGGAVSRKYNQREEEIEYTDARGNTWGYEWDVRGRLTAIIRPDGTREDYIRNFYGDVLQNLHPDGTSVEQIVDARGLPIQVIDEGGFSTVYEWDSRGLMVGMLLPDGTRETYESDFYGNLVRLVKGDGRVEEFQWDYFSRMVRRVRPSGEVTEYQYSNSGRLILEVHSSGERVLYGYDGVGNLTSYTDGFGTIQIEYGGLNWPCRRTFPNGESERFLYNFEGWMTREVSEASESRQLGHDFVGAVSSEVFFDGRKKEFARDPESELVAIHDAGNITQSRELDAFGNPVKISYSDDHEETFTYDSRGLLIRAEGPGGSVEFVRNEKGEVVQDVQISDGILEHVSIARDPLGRVRRLWLTEGEEFDYPRNPSGAPSSIRLPSGEVLQERYDAEGRPVARSLPHGGAIESEYDGAGRLKRRLVKAASARGLGYSGDPGWVGEGNQGIQLEKAFAYGAGPSPISKVDSHRPAVFYRYDARERLLAREDSNGLGEHFAHDPVGNLYESDPGAPGRRYEAGNRLVARGRSRFEYDDVGRLSAKVEVLDDGSERRWTYEWSAKHLLSAVNLPGGGRVDFAYDPLSRRTYKHFSEPDPLTGALVSVRSSRYVWNEDQLVQERMLEDSGDGSLRETLTTYLYGDGGYSPEAQQTTVRERGQERVGPWYFLVRGESEAPEELVDGAGQIVARLDRSAYGTRSIDPSSQAQTQVGFLGQFFDEETGLFYSRFRYYDPEVGRFISQDPVGTLSGSNVYHYTPNPIGYADPFGLASHGLSISVVLGGEEISETFESGRRTAKGKKYSTPDKSQHGTHTEPQALNWLEEQAKKKGVSLKKQQVAMTGQSPPCPQCSKRMRAFANRTGATINYTYPDGKTVQYAPGAKKSPTYSGDDPETKRLCHNYNEQHDRTMGENVETGDGFGRSGPKKKGKPNYEKPPNPKLPKGKETSADHPVWQSYQTEKASAEEAAPK